MRLVGALGKTAAWRVVYGARACLRDWGSTCQLLPSLESLIALGEKERGGRGEGREGRGERGGGRREEGGGGRERDQREGRRKERRERDI